MTSSDSQYALAQSIARVVRTDLPGAGTEEEVTASVGQALRQEACANERSIAYLRLGMLGGLTFVLAGLAASDWAEMAWVPAGTVALLVTMGLWLLVALAVAVLVARGWYPPGWRRNAPVLDALIITSSFTLLERSLTPDPVPAGLIALLTTTCVFLAFSGALRMSRTSARRAGILGVLVWLYGAVLAGVGVVETVTIAAVIGATAVLGTRFTRGIRRVVTNEVERVRLQELYRTAQETIDAREEVLKIVSHDLRNPLGTIAMAADLLLDLPGSEEQRRRYLVIIKRSGERATRLVLDLLDAARMEAGRLPLEPEVVTVDVLIDDAVEMMAPHAAESSLILEVAPAGKLPPVSADPQRILQVFSNLIGNAIKFTPPGGTITLEARLEDGSVRLSVRDTGPGIPPDQLARIFERLWQSTPGDRRGIGLGLTIARAIVEAHGERIGVESVVGEGTEFWFTLSAIDQPISADVGAVPDRQMAPLKAEERLRSGSGATVLERAIRS
jgi:signal transduction histidine kinase